MLPVASVNVPLTDEMRANAVIIVETGRRLGVPDAGIVVALAAAAQESSLRNLHRGDRDSQGLFQQRPSEGWGTIDEVLDPVRAATAFYGGATNPNPGRTRGLLDIEGLGVDDGHRGRPGRPAERASRPLRQVGGLGAGLARRARLTHHDGVAIAVPTAFATAAAYGLS